MFISKQQSALLRYAFIAGAITDGAALLPMLFPASASFLWGIEDVSSRFRFAMGYGAALMLGWTALLVWAFQRPIERRFVAALTVLVILGLVIAEIAAVHSGVISAARMAPTWYLQAGLLALFAYAYHFPLRKRPIEF